jgi:hypothetical protein
MRSYTKSQTRSVEQIAHCSARDERCARKAPLPKVGRASCPPVVGLS